RLDGYFQSYFTKTDLFWTKKNRNYLKLAQKQFISENELSALEYDSSNKSRAHYLIQHTRYSKCVNQFRMELHQVVALFNDSMSTALRPKAHGIPFPELEDKNLVLEQSKQIMAIKRIFNSLYHVEGIV